MANSGQGQEWSWTSPLLIAVLSIGVVAIIAMVFVERRVAALADIVGIDEMFEIIKLARGESIVLIGISDCAFLVARQEYHHLHNGAVN